MPPIGVAMLPNVAPKPSLMLTVPHLIWRATDRARSPSWLQIAALRPYSPSFARVDRLGLVGEPVDRHHRAERLVAEARHLGRHALEDGRLVEVRRQVRPRRATGEHARALGDGVVDVGGHGLELVRRDERAHVDLPVERGAERHRLGARDEPLDEPVVDLVGDEEALDRRHTAGRRWRSSPGRRPRRPARRRRRAVPAAGSCRRARASSRSAARRTASRSACRSRSSR